MIASALLDFSNVTSIRLRTTHPRSLAKWPGTRKRRTSRRTKRIWSRLMPNPNKASGKYGTYRRAKFFQKANVVERLHWAFRGKLVSFLTALKPVQMKNTSNEFSNRTRRGTSLTKCETMLHNRLHDGFKTTHLKHIDALEKLTVELLFYFTKCVIITIK